MGEITELLVADTAGFVDGINAAADAVEGLEAKWSGLLDKINSGMAAGGAGPDKLVASWEAAAGRLTGIVDKMAADVNARLAAIGATGTPFLDRLATSADAAAGSISGSVDKITGSLGKLDEAGAAAAGAGEKVAAFGDEAKGAAGGADSLAGSSAAAADGVKGLGTSASGAAGELAALRAEMAATAAANDKTMASIAANGDLNAKIAANKRLSMTEMKMASDDALAAQAAQTAQAKAAATDAEASSSKHSMVVLGLAAALGYGVDKAAQLQTQVTRLYTSAGESQKNLPMIEQGILGMAGPDATSQAQLAQGAYWVESAGFHGKSALNVLGSVAQGAYAEGAPVQDVANAATSILTSYGMYDPTKQQTNSVINQMLTAVGSGKMTMAGLSTALPSILPVAATAGLSLPQVLGSLATMTAPGASPEWAAQNLGHTIGKLQNPTAVMTAEMYQLGLDPVQMSQHLGQLGISGSMNEIQAAIKAHELTSGPDKGMVKLPAMNISKAAQQDALIMMKQMPPAIRSVAQAYYDGKISAAAWNQEMFKGSESAGAKALLQQFATVTNLAHGYNQALKSGQPDVQAYNAAVSKTLGDSVAMRTYLELTGQHAAVTASNIQHVSQAAKDAGQNVQGWADIQKTFNYQLKAFEYGTQSAATSIGAALLPEATTLMSGLAHVGAFMAQNPELTKILGIGGGAIGASYAISKVASPVMTGLQGIGKVAQVLHIPVLDKLANIGSSSGSAGAAAGLDKVTGSGNAAAGALDRLAGAAEKAAVGEDAAGAAGEKAALGETRAGAAGAAAGAGTAEGEAAAGAAAAEGAGASKLRGLGGSVVGGLLIAPAVIDSLENPRNDHQLGNTNPKSWWNNWGTMMHGLATSLDFGGGTPGPPAPTAGAGSRYGIYAAGSLPAQESGPAIASPPPPLTGPPSPAPTENISYRTAAGLRGTATQAEAQAATIKAKVEVDTTALNTAKTRAMNALQQISSAKVQPAKIPEPDMSGVNAAKTKAQNALQQIANAKVQPIKIPEPDTSGVNNAKTKVISTLASIRGPATAAGAGAGAGLAAGILSEQGAVEAAAQTLAHEAAAALRSALQTHSPSKVTFPIGEDFAGGFTSGATSHKSKAKAKAASMSIAASTVTSLTQGLQGGQSAIDAAMTALLGKDARPQDIQQIDATVQTLMGDLSTAMGKKIISKSEDSALVAFLKKDQSKLDTLAGKRATLEAEITNAQQVTQAGVDAGSIMNAPNAQPPSATEPLSSYSLVQGMQYQVASQKQFTSDVAKLKKMGLNSTELSQIIGAGAGQGDQVAQGILSGGKGAVGQLNQLQGQLTGSAAQLGDIAGPVMYQSGQAITSQSAKGLKSQLGQVDATMKQVATSMVNAVKAAVGGSGLESAMKAAGQNAGESFAGGILGEIPSAQSAGAQLAQAAAQGAARGAAQSAHSKPQPPHHTQPPHHHAQPQPQWGLPGGGSGGAAGHPATAAAPVVNVHVTVNVNLDGQQMFGALQGASLGHALNNWRTGLALPYKAG